MAYFNNAFRKTMILTDYIDPVVAPASAASGALTAGDVSIYDAKAWTPVDITGVPATQTACQFIIAAGAPYPNDKIGPFHGGYQESIKSKGINPKYVSKIWTTTASVAQPFVLNIGSTVDTIDDAITQYNAYIASKENKQYTELVINKDAQSTKELSDEQVKLQEDVRILQTAIKNIGYTKDGTINLKKGLIKYYLENSAFDITKQKYVEVDDELDDAMAQNDPLNSEKVGEQKVNEKKLTELADKETLYILKSLFKIGVVLLTLFRYLGLDGNKLFVSICVSFK